MPWAWSYLSGDHATDKLTYLRYKFNVERLSEGGVDNLAALAANDQKEVARLRRTIRDCLEMIKTTKKEKRSLGEEHSVGTHSLTSSTQATSVYSGLSGHSFQRSRSGSSRVSRLTIS